MSIIVKTQNGRLIIKNGQRSIDKSGEFIDAISLEDKIIVLLKSGRVQELKNNGDFIRDIATKAISITLVDDIIIVKSANGRFSQYKNGKFISSGSGADYIKRVRQTQHNKKDNAAELLGAHLSDKLFDLLSVFAKFMYRKLKK